MKAFVHMLLIVTSSLSSTACMRAPVVELTNVRLGGIGLRGATLIAVLSVDNPNVFTIETDSITFEFHARYPGQQESWTAVTNGTNKERFRIERKSETTVEIPIQFSYSDLSTPLRSLIDRGTFDYRIRGRVFIGKPLRRAVPFTQDGDLSLGGTRG